MLSASNKVLMSLLVGIGTLGLSLIRFGIYFLWMGMIYPHKDLTYLWCQVPRNMGINSRYAKLSRSLL